MNATANTPNTATNSNAILRKKAHELYHHAPHVFFSTAEVIVWLRYFCENTPMDIDHVDAEDFSFDTNGQQTDVFYGRTYIETWK